MRWIARILGAALLVAVAAQPASAVVVVTNWGQADTPQFAIPAAFVDVFFNHSNGKRYHCNTGAYGVCNVDMPPGTIVFWNAWQEDTLIASSNDAIPVGGEALQTATKAAQTGRTDETPMPDDRPSVVVSVRGKDGRFKHYDVARRVAAGQEKNYPPILDVLPDEAFASADKLFDTLTKAGMSEGLAKDIVWFALFFGIVPEENASAGDGDGGSGN